MRLNCLFTGTRLIFEKLCRPRKKLPKPVRMNPRLRTPPRVTLTHRIASLWSKSHAFFWGRNGRRWTNRELYNKTQQALETLTMLLKKLPQVSSRRSKKSRSSSMSASSTPDINRVSGGGSTLDLKRTSSNFTQKGNNTVADGVEAMGNFKVITILRCVAINLFRTAQYS